MIQQRFMHLSSVAEPTRIYHVPCQVAQQIQSILNKHAIGSFSIDKHDQNTNE